MCHHRFSRCYYPKRIRLLRELYPSNDRKFTTNYAEELSIYSAKRIGFSELKALVDLPIVYNRGIPCEHPIKFTRAAILRIFKMIHGDNAIETSIAVEPRSRNSCQKYHSQNRCQISSNHKISSVLEILKHFMPVFHHFLSVSPKNSLHKLLIMDYTYLNIILILKHVVQKRNKKAVL